MTPISNSLLKNLAMLMLVVSPWTRAADTSLSIAEPFGFEQALRTADRDALTILAKSPIEDVRRIAMASLSRLDGDLAASDATADACYAWAESQRHFMTATRCLTIKAGNAYLRGEDRQVAQDFAKVRGEFKEHVAPGIPANARYWPAEFMPEGTSFSHYPETDGVIRPTVGTYAFQPASGDVPTLPIDINGHTVNAIFDTGSMKSAVSDDLAQKFELTPDGQWLGLLADGAIQYSSRYVAKITFLGNSLGTRSLAGLRTPGMAIVGRDIMQHIGTFEISSAGLKVLNKNDSDVQRCTDRMLSGSSLDGTYGGIYIPLVVSGTKTQAFFDTGHTTFLSKYVGSQPIHWPANEWTAQHVTRANSNDTTYFHLVDGYIAIGQAANVWLQGKVKLETSAWEEPGTYALGSRSLKNVRYVFDFDRHHLCAYLKEG